MRKLQLERSNEQTRLLAGEDAEMAMGKVLRLEGRRWTILGLYAPVHPDRGVRARVLAEDGFVSFIGQADWMVLLGWAVPGQSCGWRPGRYPDPDAREWEGLLMEDEDHEDDLWEWECWIREQNDGQIPLNMGVDRPVHVTCGCDRIQYDMLLREGELGPAGIFQRWTRIERRLP